MSFVRHYTSMTGRLRITVPKLPHSNLGNDTAFGASDNRNRTIAAPNTASRELPIISACHCFNTPIPSRRCGSAEPNVSAPISMPIAVPRPFENHRDTICTATGYTPANDAPVRARRMNSTTRCLASRTNKEFVTAATIAETISKCRGDKRSGKAKLALINAPMTKPHCTAVVSQIAELEDRCHVCASDPATADVLNHTLIVSSSAILISARATHGDFVPGFRLRAK